MHETECRSRRERESARENTVDFRVEQFTDTYVKSMYDYVPHTYTNAFSKNCKRQHLKNKENEYEKIAKRFRQRNKVKEIKLISKLNPIEKHLEIQMSTRYTQTIPFWWQ